MSSRRSTALVSCLALATPFVAGCGGSGLTANSSCRDFMNAAPQDQDAAVSSLAGQLHAPSADTPLGRPNVNYLCSDNPTMSLGDAVSHSG